MSPSIQSAQAQWLEQLASMRAAIAEIKLDQAQTNSPSYGDDLLLDDDLTGGSGSDDVWDVFSDPEEDDYSSDSLDDQEHAYTNGEISSSGSGYGIEWLKSKTAALASRISGLDGEELLGHILAMLASASKGMLVAVMFRSLTDLHV